MFFRPRLWRPALGMSGDRRSYRREGELPGPSRRARGGHGRGPGLQDVVPFICCCDRPEGHFPGAWSQKSIEWKRVAKSTNGGTREELLPQGAEAGAAPLREPFGGKWTRPRPVRRWVPGPAPRTSRSSIPQLQQVSKGGPSQGHRRTRSFHHHPRLRGHTREGRELISHFKHSWNHAPFNWKKTERTLQCPA